MSSHHAPVWPIYKRLLGYTRTYWVFMVGAVIAMVVEALAGYHFTKLMEPLVNEGFVDPQPRAAVVLPLTILGLFLMRSVATWVSDYTLAKTGRSVVRDLREQVLQKYLHLPSSHFDTEATPVMVSRLNFDTEQVTQASADALKTVVADTLTIIAMLAVMLQMSVKVTLAMLLVVPLIGALVSYVGKRYRRISRGIQDGMGTMAQTAEQSLAAQQEVKVHGTQQHEISRYSRLANRMRKTAPWPVDWIDPAEAIARRALSLLPQRPAVLPPVSTERTDIALFTSGKAAIATRRLMQGFGLTVQEVETRQAS